MAEEIKINRLRKELVALERDPPPGISCYPKDDDLSKLEAYIKGPPDTPYEKGLFKLDIQIPDNYPFEPPQMRFLTRLYHPNIDDAGRICLDILKKGENGSWKPALNLGTTLLSLVQLLAYPNPDDPLDAEIAREYQINLPTFKQKALEFTLKYANEDTAMSCTNDQIEVKVEETLNPPPQPENHYQETEDVVIKSKPKLSLSKKKGIAGSSQSNSSQSSQSTQSSLSSANAPSLKRKIQESFNSGGSQKHESSLEKQMSHGAAMSKIKKPKLNNSDVDAKEKATEMPIVPIAKKSLKPSTIDMAKKSPKPSTIDMAKKSPKPLTIDIAKKSSKPSTIDIVEKDTNILDILVDPVESSDVVDIPKANTEPAKETFENQKYILQDILDFDTAEDETESNEQMVESKHFTSLNSQPKNKAPLIEQKPASQVNVASLKSTLTDDTPQPQQQHKKFLSNSIIISSDDDDEFIHSFQLSKKLHRKKLSLSRRRK